MYIVSYRKGSAEEDGIIATTTLTATPCELLRLPCRSYTVLRLFPFFTTSLTAVDNSSESVS